MLIGELLSELWGKSLVSPEGASQMPRIHVLPLRHSLGYYLDWPQGIRFCLLPTGLLVRGH